MKKHEDALKRQAEAHEEAAKAQAAADKAMRDARKKQEE